MYLSIAATTQDPAGQDSHHKSRRIASLAPWLPGPPTCSEDGHTCPCATSSKNAVHQDLSDVCYKYYITSLSLSAPQRLSSADFPSDPHKMRPKWTSQEAFNNTGKVVCPPWRNHFFFPLEKPQHRGATFGTGLC